MSEVLTEQRKFKLWQFIIIILVICVGGYLIYNFTMKKDDNGDKNKPTPTPIATPTATPEVNQTLDINSTIVQDLYNKVKNSDYMLQIIFWNQSTPKSVTSQTISDTDKMYMAFRMINVTDIRNDSCMNHQSLNTNTGKGNICGHNTDQIVENGPTKVFSESVIKSKYENIFGPNTYKRVDEFNINLVASYRFDHNTNEYVYSSIPKGGVVDVFNTKLVSANKIGNKIEIVENISFTNIEYSSTPTFSKDMKHVFILNTDGNYYYSNTN